MKKAALAAIAAFVALSGAGVAAHHSAQQFDFGKSVAISGVVKRFQSINPHMRLVITVSDAKGSRDVSFEGHSTNNMYRAGYRDGMIKAGDKITVFVAPLRDGSEGGQHGPARHRRTAPSRLPASALSFVQSCDSWAGSACRCSCSCSTSR